MSESNELKKDPADSGGGGGNVDVGGGGGDVVMKPPTVVQLVALNGADGGNALRVAPTAPYPPSIAQMENLAFRSRITVTRTEDKQELIAEWKRCFSSPSTLQTSSARNSVSRTSVTSAIGNNNNNNNNGGGGGGGGGGSALPSSGITGSGRLVEGERLVRVFRCALAKPTLMEGKMWVSEYHLCFKLNWPGQTSVILDFSQIIDIRRSSFANMIPNAMEIETLGGETYFFGSLTGRGEKLDLINGLWDQHVQPASLLRRFPDLSLTRCTCKSNDVAIEQGVDNGTCDFCVKSRAVKADPLNPLNSNKKRNGSGNLAVPGDSSSARPSIDMQPPSPLNQDSVGTLESSSSSSQSLLEQVRQERLLERETLESQQRLGQQGLSSVGDDLLIAESKSRSSPPAVQINGRTSSEEGSTKISSDSSASTSLPLHEHSHATTSCSCSEPSEKGSNYEKVYESKIPFGLPILWQEWWCAPCGGNAFLRYLIGPLKITELEIAPWAGPGELAGEEHVPLEKIGGGDFEPAWSSVKAGMYRKTSRVIPLKHGIPFIPKTTLGLDTYTIMHVTDDQLCIKDEAHIVVMGIITNVKVCIKQLSPNECSLNVYIELIFTGKGKLNAPRMLAEKGTLDGVRSFYKDLLTFFEKNIDRNEAAVSVGACDCASLCTGKEGRKELFVSEFLPISLEKLWRELFLVNSEGNAYTKHAIDTGFTDLEFQPWEKSETQKRPFLPWQSPQWASHEEPFSGIQVGMFRNAKYNVSPKESVPFVPQSIPAITTQKVLGVTPHSLCLESTTIVADFGIETSVRLCIKSLSSTKTKVSVFGSVKDLANLSAGSLVAKYPAPQGWRDPMQVVASFYKELFTGDHLIPTVNSVKEEQAGRKEKRELEQHKHDSHGVSRIKESGNASFNTADLLKQLISSRSQEQFMQYLVAFLFVMLMVNTIILWNIVNHLAVLTEKLNNLT